MVTSINQNVASGICEITFFLTELYEHIGKSDSLVARSESFGGYKKTEEEDRYFFISFNVRKLPRRGDVINIGAYGYGDMQNAENACIYIEQLSNDTKLWDRLKNQFPAPINQVVEDDDSWWIALEWPHGIGADAATIEASAKEIGDKIIAALLSDD
ncbi:hypothetical protein SAMN05421693_11270 [Ectothiorhodospira magna]|uniref:Uncharacterized protein n=1 Tax=Ectothiorhodospira magna TaxID=867345 RepID=A0A1H9C6G8_9GAMM|nr:hypothetical protein [Ectothiorhodospira magna]SEP96722.1 hypothetical protein SAMN05421693_11270 [Ectothiorhodospira magna]